MTTVMCVYRSGGDFKPEYVKYLADAVRRNTTKAYEFMCLTDQPTQVLFPGVDIVIPLRHNWPGWWSKIELFRGDLTRFPAVYFDLDTVILGSIDLLVQAAETTLFAMLHSFNPRLEGKGASGVMIGKFFELNRWYVQFCKGSYTYMQDYAKRTPGTGMNGDQGYINDVMGIDLVYIQDLLPEGYIAGKRHIRQGEAIDNCHVLAWSGKPRLHTLNEQLGKLWRNENTDNR